MDAVTILTEGLPVVLYFVLFVVVPGFFLSLVIFSRKNSLSAIDRLVYSTVLGTSSGIALVMFLYSVLGLDITPVNFVLAAVVFSAVLLIIWACERWYLNKQAREHRKPDITADQQYPRFSRTKTAPPEQDDWTVVPSTMPDRPEQSPLPPVILPGWRGKDKDVQARSIREESPERTVARPGGEPAAMAPEGTARAEPENVPPGPAVQPLILSKNLHKRLALPTGAGPKAGPTRQKAQARVQVKESRKQEETRIVVASIRKLQQDIQRDLDQLSITPDSFPGTKKNIENIRIPKKADVNKRLAEVKEELKDLDWLND